MGKLLRELWGLMDITPGDEDNGGGEPDETTTDGNEAGKSAETINTDTPPADAPADSGARQVPYERFQEVNGKYRETEKQVKQLMEEMSSLKSQLTPAQQKALFNDPEMQKTFDTYVRPGIMPVIREIESMKEEIAADRQAVKIEKQLNTLKAQYSEMDEEEVLDRLIAHPDMDLSELAEESHNKLKALRTKYVEEYRAGKKADSMHKTASPTGSESPSFKVPQRPKELKTFEDKMRWAGQQAAKFLKVGKE